MSLVLWPSCAERHVRPAPTQIHRLSSAPAVTPIAVAHCAMRYASRDQATFPPWIRGTALAVMAGMRRSSLSPLAFAVVFVLAACSGAVADRPPAQDGGVDSPSSGLDVQAAISSATLGDQGCTGSTMARSGGACIAPQTDAAVGPGPCGGPCRPSTIQIQFTAGVGSAPAHIEVADVRLLDSAGAMLQQLSASAPQVWDVTAGAYSAWDQTVSPSSQLKTSYTLSPPSWSSFGQSYSATYRLEITLRIDGTPLVLQSGPLNREPLVAT
jgi:hypothetical protein